MSYAIQVESLTKSYNGNTVLKELNFCVSKGEIFALLGANGAGKTTALECIEGLKQYDSGNISIYGKVGIQLQSSSLPACLKVSEAIKLFSLWNKTTVDNDMLKGLGIDELANKQYEKMSTGQKRRLHLALALISNPDIIFLDEPTAGLDVGGRIALHEEIRKLKARGKTVIMASHDMAEVEKLCDRIAIIKDGKVFFCGTVGELAERFSRKYKITITTSAGEDTMASDNISEDMLGALQDYKNRKVDVLDIKISRGTLEDEFVTISKEKQ